MFCIYTVCLIFVSHHVLCLLTLFSSHAFTISICCFHYFSFLLSLSSPFHHLFPPVEIYMPPIFFKWENVACVNPFYLFVICLMAQVLLFLSSLARSMYLCTLCTVVGKEWGLHIFEKEVSRLNSFMCGYAKAINCMRIRAHLWIEVFFYTITYILPCLGCMNITSCLHSDTCWK